MTVSDTPVTREAADKKRKRKAKEERTHTTTTRIAKRFKPASTAEVVNREGTFRFFDLPGELRNMIYDMTIEPSEARFWGDASKLHRPTPPPGKKPRRINAGCKLPRLPSIVKSSKQAHNESINLFYSKLTVYFSIVEFDRVTAWYSRLPLMSRQSMMHFRYSRMQETGVQRMNKIRERMSQLGIHKLPTNVEVIPTDRYGEPVAVPWTNNPESMISSELEDYETEEETE